MSRRRKKCCCTPPTGAALDICWLCAGAPGDGFFERIGYNHETGRYEGQNVRGTAQGNTLLVQRLCHSGWAPAGGFPVPINPFLLNPPYTQVPDSCCPCGIALVTISQHLNSANCGLGCEGGIFGSPYNQLPTDWDVQIGASLTNDGWNACSLLADTYTVTGNLCGWRYTNLVGEIKPGKNCGATYPCGTYLDQPFPECPDDPDHKCCDPLLPPPIACADGCYTPLSGQSGDCALSLKLDFIRSVCGGQFILEIHFGCFGPTHQWWFNDGLVTNCQGHATYASDVFTAVSAVPASVTLNLQDSSSGPACSGSMPGSITMTAA